MWKNKNENNNNKIINKNKNFDEINSLTSLKSINSKITITSNSFPSSTSSFPYSSSSASASASSISLSSSLNTLNTNKKIINLLNDNNKLYYTSSIKRKKELLNEFNLLKNSIEEVYKTYRKKRKQDIITTRYLQWNEWLKKKSSNNTNVKLTKREFEKLWNWFGDHMDASDIDEEGGIQIEKIVDAFVEHGVFQTRLQALKLVKNIDKDGNEDHLHHHEKILERMLLLL